MSGSRRAGWLLLFAAFALRAETDLKALFPKGETPDPAVLEAVAPEVKDAKLVYLYDFRKPLLDDQQRADYLFDRSAGAGSDFKTVGYLVYLAHREAPDGKPGKTQYVWTTMDAFTDDARKIGVPTRESGAIFQQPVKNLTVKSNVDDLKNGFFAEGSLEFWPYNYTRKNEKKIYGASDHLYDFGDQMLSTGSHGSMQLHNPEERQTVFAYNNWVNAPNADLGIGPGQRGEPDWTHSRNADKDHRTALLFVFVK